MPRERGSISPFQPYFRATIIEEDLEHETFLLTVFSPTPVFLGLMPGPKSYFLDFPNVFVTTCGTSFYSQCFPSGTVNLGFSATAMHWFREKPPNVKGAFHHILVEDPETAEKLKKQAEEDWELLLLQREKEMAPGEL